LTVRFLATFGAFFAGALRAVLVLVFFAAIFSASLKTHRAANRPRGYVATLILPPIVMCQTKKYIAILRAASTFLGPRNQPRISAGIAEIRPIEQNAP
jgi:hypothetical protein